MHATKNAKQDDRAINKDPSKDTKLINHQIACFAADFVTHLLSSENTEPLEINLHVKSSTNTRKLLAQANSRSRGRELLRTSA